MEKVNFGGWENCYRITHDDIEIIVTSDVGPRIIRFGAVGGENELKEFSDQLGTKGGNTWRSYGGHRLWAAPEDKVKTYYPDNFPVKVQEVDHGFSFLADAEAVNHIQKLLTVRIVDNQVKVDHKITNTGEHPIDVSAWALTVMAPGGTTIIPLPERGPHPQFLTPVNKMILWKYTDLSDARWKFLERHILGKQDVSISQPQKLGFFLPDGWLGYANHGNLFIKMFEVNESAVYPDLGSNAEVYFDHRILELESLSPLKLLEPGEHIEHHEIWRLFRNFSFHQDTISKDILKIEESIKIDRLQLENK